MSDNKKRHMKQDNLAVPEFHTDEYDEKQDEADREDNAELEKKDIVYDTVAVPEIHLHRKKKKK